MYQLLYRIGSKLVAAVGSVVITDGLANLIKRVFDSDTTPERFVVGSATRQFALNAIYNAEGMEGLAALYKAGLCSREEVALFLIREMSRYAPIATSSALEKLESQANSILAPAPWYSSLFSGASDASSLSSDPATAGKMLSWLTSALGGSVLK